LNRIKILILILFVFLGCAKINLKNHSFTKQNITNWSMFGGNPERTNFYPGNILLPLDLSFRFSTQAAIGKTITVNNGVIFFTTMDGNLYALDIEKGKKLGRKKTELHSTVAVTDSLAFIARRYGDDTLFKYNLYKSRTEWHFNAGDISSEPLLLEDNIVITALYKHIDMYDIKSGEKKWTFETDDNIHSSPAANGDRIFFGCDDGFVYALNSNNGQLVWKFQTEGSVQSTPTIKEETVYIGSTDFSLYALDFKSGEQKWKFETGGQLFHANAVNDSLIITGSTDACLYCLNRHTGELLWKFEAGSVISTSPLICNNKVFVGSLDHFYYALDISTGEELWSFETKGRIRTAPVIWENYFIGASENNFVYIFKGAEE